jgi:hypothetical protein
MPEITLFEADSAAKADWTLLYSQSWSVAAKRGTPVLQADISVVYFFVKANESDASAWLTLTDASSTQVEWLDGALGKIRVHFPEGTEGHAGTNQYELRLKFTSGKFLTVERGTLYVRDSLIDTP